MEEKPNCDQHSIGKIELPNRIEKQGSTALNVASTLGMHKLYVNRFQPVGQKLFYEAFNGLGKPIYFKRAHLIAKRCIPWIILKERCLFASHISIKWLLCTLYWLQIV